MRRVGSIGSALVLMLSLIGTALAATVPQAVYSPKGEARPLNEVEASLAIHGVKDVTTKHWAAGSISVLLDAALIAPDAEGNLKPDAPVGFDRGVAVLARVLGADSPLHTSELAAEKLVDAGLVQRREDGKLTRLDVALLLFTVLGLQEKTGVTADTVGFTDAAQIAALKEARVFIAFPGWCVPAGWGADPGAAGGAGGPDPRGLRQRLTDLRSTERPAQPLDDRGPGWGRPIR